ncbi:thioesterase [Acrocarpospora pleiomorpha]|uniref:Thioesterase n=1 Tax=Acrocarpospora pleiomorpha TaxID=90975 RepID=A0A5M3XNM0_9ACTN|nr:alpha/beta fold hydrolase [Acrocarpospora pleiomorpha]GES22935.1 thioesterase [Acrocarpospora pleiomorpha]
MSTADDVSTAWIRRYHPAAQAGRRLVCFPHAGGSASFFLPTSAKFAPDTDVVAIQYPGRQDRLREPCITDIGMLADRIVDELIALSEKPTVFFGHSMGSVIGFEVASRLERKGVGAPHTLIASGRRGPSTHRDESVHRRDDDGIIAELKVLNGTDAGVLGDEEIIRMSLPALRGDHRAIETYRGDPEQRLRGSITVLTGDADPKTTVEEAEVWRRHTEGSFRIRVFAGGHFFLTRHQQAVNEEIAQALGA